MSVQGITALILAVSGLITAAGALWHSIRTRKQMPPKP
jgi:hypothetical protein